MNEKKLQEERGLIWKNHNQKVSLFDREQRRLEWTIKERKPKRDRGGVNGCL